MVVLEWIPAEELGGLGQAIAAWLSGEKRGQNICIIPEQAADARLSVFINRSSGLLHWINNFMRTSIPSTPRLSQSCLKRHFPRLNKSCSAQIDAVGFSFPPPVGRLCHSSSTHELQTLLPRSDHHQVVQKARAHFLLLHFL